MARLSNNKASLPADEQLGGNLFGLRALTKLIQEFFSACLSTSTPWMEASSSGKADIFALHFNFLLIS